MDNELDLYREHFQLLKRAYKLQTELKAIEQRLQQISQELDKEGELKKEENPNG